MPAFVNRESTTLQTLELSGFLHSNFLSYRSYVSLHVLSSHDRLRLYLVNHVLNELAPLHKAVTIYVNLFEQTNQPLNHLNFFFFYTGHFDNHEFHKLRESQPVFALLPDLVQPSQSVFGQTHHNTEGHNRQRNSYNKGKSYSGVAYVSGVKLNLTLYVTGIVRSMYSLIALSASPSSLKVNSDKATSSRFCFSFLPSGSAPPSTISLGSRQLWTLLS